MKTALYVLGLSVAWLGLACHSIAAQETGRLRGEAFLAGKTPIDPPPNEPKNTHAYVTIAGIVALRMYDGMLAKEEQSACEPGKRLKRAGNLFCQITPDRRNATCDFAVDLIRGSLDEGRPC